VPQNDTEEEEEGAKRKGGWCDITHKRRDITAGNEEGCGSKRNGATDG